MASDRPRNPIRRALALGDEASLLHNASANLRASQIKRERSELPCVARQVQRTFANFAHGSPG